MPKHDSSQWKIGKALLLMFVIITALAGCNTVQTSEKSGKLLVYTSFYPMYDFAAKIGGDKINVVSLIPGGTEPHDWEPSPQDMAKLEKADVFIYNGLGMEPWIDKILAASNNPNLLAVEASKGLKTLQASENPSHSHDGENSGNTVQNHNDSEYDPHIWLNPLYAKQQMENIKNALVKADPDNKDYYEKNYAYYASKFDELDQEYKKAVQTFTKKDIIVTHESFGYLCEAYGLNQIGIKGLSPDSEPTAARMAEIADFARKNNITYIFFEELISPKVAQTIANEVGAKTAVLNPLEGLSEEDIKNGKDYFSVMRENLEVLRKALQ